jgi:hypothetical protein
MTRTLRVLGAVTVGYSVAIAAAPRLLAGPCRMTDVTGSTPTPVATLIRGIAARDTAIGLAMMIAPPGVGLGVATAARVASDLGDTVAFGVGLPDAATKAKIAGFAAAFAAVNAVALARSGESAAALTALLRR